MAQKATLIHWEKKTVVHAELQHYIIWRPLNVTPVRYISIFILVSRSWYNLMSYPLTGHRYSCPTEVLYRHGISLNRQVYRVWNVQVWRMTLWHISYFYPNNNDNKESMGKTLIFNIDFLYYFLNFLTCHGNSCSLAGYPPTMNFLAWYCGVPASS